MLRQAAKNFNYASVIIQRIVISTNSNKISLKN
jgi:hypothetical protein